MNKETFFSDRPFDLKKQVIDQVGHVLYAAAVLAPILAIDNQIAGAAVSAVVCGFIREWEQWTKRYKLHLVDRSVDVIFFGIGGAIVGFLF